MQQKRSYEIDLEVDKDNLDTEWTGYPTKYMEWRKIEVDAQELTDKASRRLEVVKAEMDEAIRLNPQKYGLDKPTEPAIKNALIRSKEVENAENELIAAKKHSRLMAGAVASMDKVGKSLDNLTDLWIAGYWSGKDVPRKFKEKVREELSDESCRVLEQRKRARIQKEKGE